MNCPRHAVALIDFREKNREIERCPECEGLWVPGRLIDPLIRPGQKKILRGMCKEHRTTLACPHDGVALGEAKIRGVTIDFCPNCNGVWLDAGELKHLREQPEIPKRRHRSAAEIRGRKAIKDLLFGIAERILL
jgi:Zn-finger nucleic acid-binding protein